MTRLDRARRILALALALIASRADAAAAVSLHDDPTSQLIAYITELHWHGSLSAAALRGMIESARLSNPISEVEATAGLVAHRRLFDRYLAYPQLDGDRVRKAVRKLVTAESRVSCRKQEATGDTRFVRMQFVRIEEGQPLWIQRGRRSTPIEEITPELPFELQTTPVTRHQWQKVMAPHETTRLSDGDLPVWQLTLDEIYTFLHRLNATSKKYDYSLPSEAQWLYAVTDSGRNHTLLAKERILDYAWLADNSNHPKPVALRKPIRIGGKSVYDLVGNVTEITLRPDEGSNAVSIVGDSFGAAAGPYRSSKGWSITHRTMPKAFLGPRSDFFRQSCAMDEDFRFASGIRLTRVSRGQGTR